MQKVSDETSSRYKQAGLQYRYSAARTLTNHSAGNNSSDISSVLEAAERPPVKVSGNMGKRSEPA